MKKVVITGISIMSGFGIGPKEHWEKWISLKNGKDSVPLPDENKLLPELDFSFYIKKQIPRTLGRMSKFAIAAAKLALKDAGIEEPVTDPDKNGIILGSILGGMDEQASFFKNIYKQGPLSANPMLYSNATPNAPASQAAIELGFRGINLSLNGDNTSGIDAVGMGFKLIEQGVHKGLLLAGACENASPLLSSVWKAMKRTEAPLGEGMVILCLETEERAQERKARIYAEIKGYTSYFYPAQDDRTGKEVVLEAIDRAGIKKSQIKKVFYAGENGPAEHMAREKTLRGLLGEDVKIDHPCKSFGFWGSASSVLGIVLAALALSNNEEEENILISSWGHDGQRAALILGRKGGDF